MIWGVADMTMVFDRLDGYVEDPWVFIIERSARHEDAAKVFAIVLMHLIAVCQAACPMQ